MTDQLIFVGKITRTHGVRGELKVLEGEGCSGAWRHVRNVFVGSCVNDAIAYSVVEARGGGKFAILAIEGVDTQERAEMFKGQSVFVSRQQLPSPEEDQYYASDLIGIDVKDRQGRKLGRLTEIFDNGAHEVYVIQRGNAEMLLPVIADVVVDIDLANNRMIVDPPDGLPES